jgi:hypothetical protein
MAGHQSQHTAAHPQQQARYEGHLHAPHGKRHATSRSQVDSFISEQVRLKTAWCCTCGVLHAAPVVPGSLKVGNCYAPCNCLVSCAGLCGI